MIPKNPETSDLGARAFLVLSLLLLSRPVSLLLSHNFEWLLFICKKKKLYCERNWSTYREPSKWILGNCRSLHSRTESRRSCAHLSRRFECCLDRGLIQFEHLAQLRSTFCSLFVEQFCFVLGTEAVVKVPGCSRRAISLEWLWRIISICFFKSVTSSSPMLARFSASRIAT